MKTIRMGATACFVMIWISGNLCATAQETTQIPTEKIEGNGVWVSHSDQKIKQAKAPVAVKVWFEDQLLGDGKAYDRRAREFSKEKRTELRTKVVATLKAISNRSFERARTSISALEADGKLTDLKQHWIVNGFSCKVKPQAFEDLKNVPGIKKIFVSGPTRRVNRNSKKQAIVNLSEQDPFDPRQNKKAWYIRALLADKAWTELSATGKGTLNIIHDFNFVFSDHNSHNLYSNPGEVPGNGKDDDENGLVDDVHGFNFLLNSGMLTMVPNANSPKDLHGTSCAAIVCGRSTKSSALEFGIAPEAKWAGVIGQDIEPAIEWAVEQNADTYSMSFSRPNLGEMRSHWRKVMEHGSMCGVYFVSGAGNFAMTEKVPVQMRTPEDIPNVVFAAAGVQRDLSRTPFSSKGPVEWRTNHYRDGRIQKPEVCAFNFGLPIRMPNGQVRPTALNGNSFAGPMFCGSIAVMLSADPELLPWDLKEIITSTATDVGPEDVDDETGHGLINCYRATKEVLRRKAIREGMDASRFEGREDGDELNLDSYREGLVKKKFWVRAMKVNGGAAAAGIKASDIVLSVNEKPMDSDAFWKRSFQSSNRKSLSVVVQRGSEKLTFKVNGQSGMGPPGVLYDQPVFAK